MIIQVALGVILALIILANFDLVIIAVSALFCLAIAAAVILAGIAYPTFGIAALMLGVCAAAIELYPVAKAKGIFPLQF